MRWFPGTRILTWVGDEDVTSRSGYPGTGSGRRGLRQWSCSPGGPARRASDVRLRPPATGGSSGIRIGIGTIPAFSIGQRALLGQTPAGNVLWDCITLIDETTIRLVQSLGGISAIAISHPHYYSSMVEWAHAFDAPVYLHAADRQWVMRPDPAVRFWQGETRELLPGLTLIRCGGHFDGGTVLHWPDGAGRRGVLLTGDIINVVQDRRFVSFMYSFPNLIPLPASAVRRVVAAVEPYDYDRIYSAWWDKVTMTDAKNAVHRSAERYIAAIEGEKEEIK